MHYLPTKSHVFDKIISMHSMHPEFFVIYRKISHNCFRELISKYKYSLFIVGQLSNTATMDNFAFFFLFFSHFFLLISNFIILI